MPLIDTMFSRTVAAVERACGRSLRQAVAEGMRLGRPGPLGAAVVAATLQAIDEPVARPLAEAALVGRPARRQRLLQPRRHSAIAAIARMNWAGSEPISFSMMHAAWSRPPSRSRAYGRLAANVGWIVPHENVCWLSERHHVLKADANNERLHCATGPALAYRDGLAVHMWKGVQIPGSLVENPSRITARIDRSRTRSGRAALHDRYHHAGTIHRHGQRRAHQSGR